MRINRVFFNVYMGYGFQGLTAIAKDAKTDIGPGTVVFYLNRAATAFKVLVNGQYLTYYRNGANKIPLEAISLLPEGFGGSKLEMDKAIRAVIEKNIAKAK